MIWQHYLKKWRKNLVYEIEKLPPIGGIRMSGQESVTFQEALEIIESLPEYQQEDLIKIIRQRLLEYKRDLLAKNIGEAREEYARGEVKKGSVDDLMKELSE